MTPYVCVVEAESPLDESTFRLFMQYTPPEKRERILRQRIRQNADNMLVGAVLAKCMIAQKFGIPFSAQRISYEAYGKPYLCDYPHVHFSISHSGQLVACAVHTRPVGMDVQRIEAYKPEIARLACNEEELQEIRRSPDPAGAFAKHWTRKEAYLKLTGRGIADGLKNISYPSDIHLQSRHYGEYMISLAYKL